MAKPATTVQGDRVRRGPRPEEGARARLQGGVRPRAVGRRTHGSGDPQPPLHPQGLPRPLVVPARGDRALLLHHPAHQRRVPDHLVQAVDGRDRVRGQLPAAPRRGHVGVLRLHAGASPSTSAVACWSVRCTTGRRRSSWPRCWRTALRVFFTGAFRKPREINWVIGVAMLMLGLIEGFAGYSLPDDLLSGTGLRFVDGLDPVHPGDRHLGRVLRLRRRVPRRPDHRPPLHGPHPAAARDSSWA